MANVLPIAYQKKVAHVQIARLVLVLSGAIFAITVILALALMPSYLALTLATTAEPDSSANRVVAEDARTMAHTQALVSQLHAALSVTSSPRGVVALAIEARPLGVRVDRVMYSAPEGDKLATLQIVGNASREHIAAYRDALVANPQFSNVVVPVAALIGNASGNFSITLTVRDIQSSQ